MTRPLVKELPKGSPAEFYVNRLVAEGAEPLWQYQDEALRAVGIQVLLKEEPRMWRLPREVVRDELVLPALAKVEGADFAGVMKQSVGMLNEYVDLICEDEKRRAPARKRQAPEKDISWAVTGVVLAALYDGYCQAQTPNANHDRTAKRLGISRGQVRRLDQRFRMRARAPGLLEAIVFIQAMLAKYDRERRKRSA